MPERFLLDKILVLLGLGILLYIGIYVNYYLLNSLVPSYVNWLVIVGVLIVCALESILSYVRYGNYSYEFHEHTLVIDAGKTKSIDYSDIHNIHYSMNLLDKLLKTGSIVLELKDRRNIRLKYLKNPNQAYFLLQKSISRQ